MSMNIAATSFSSAIAAAALGALLILAHEAQATTPVDASAAASANTSVNTSVNTSANASKTEHVDAKRPYVLLGIGWSGTVVRSKDGGITWAAVPHSGTTSDLIDAVALASGIAVAVGRDGAMVRSSDGGATWKSVKPASSSTLLNALLLKSDGTLLAAGVRGKMLRSTDQGETWSTALTGITKQISAMAEDPQGVVVAVGADGTIVRSTDGGITWSNHSRHAPGGFLDVRVARDGAWVAAGGVSVRSTDHGDSWVDVKDNGAHGLVFGLIVGSKGDLVSADLRGGIALSTDGGITWSAQQSHASGPLGTGVLTPSGALLVGGDDGTILRSIDDGRTWVVAHRPDDLFIVHFFVAPDGVVFAMGARGSAGIGAVLRSTDDGASWSPVKAIGTRHHLSRVLALPLNE